MAIAAETGDFSAANAYRAHGIRMLALRAGRTRRGRRAFA
jgi:hypothetical protein